MVARRMSIRRRPDSRAGSRSADGEFAGDVAAMISSLVDREPRRAESVDAVARREAAYGEISPAGIAVARMRRLH